jgi:RHS repeat-associated protein
MHRDHLGSTRVVTDIDGRVVAASSFEPFGEEVAWREPRLGAEETAHRFTGHERDEASGLDYMMARYFDPDLGRFLSRDPLIPMGKNLVHPQRWNRYTYALNNPVNFTDPTGEDPFLVARPLGGDPNSKIAHMFVASHARYPGDPEARVYSWGMKDNGRMGRVDDGTRNRQSKGTHAADRQAWLSLAQPGSTAAATAIPATDAETDAAAGAVMENKDYASTAIGGVNSNSAAQAEADEAAGEPVGAPGTRLPVGASSSEDVDFDKDEDGKPDPKRIKPSPMER